MDVDAFIRSFEIDGNIGSDQLGWLNSKDHGDVNANCIATLGERFPGLHNRRDGHDMGNTLIHCFARDGNAVALSRWLPDKATQSCLRAVPGDSTGSGSYIAIENKETTRPPGKYGLLLNDSGESALRIAVETNPTLDVAEYLVRRLDPSISLTGTLTSDLTAIARSWPREITRFVDILTFDTEYKLFRAQRKIHRLTRHLEDFAVQGHHSEDGESVKWPIELPNSSDDGIQCECTSEVLALRGFAARPASNCYDATTSPLTSAIGPRQDAVVKSAAAGQPPFTALFNSLAQSDATAGKHLNDLLETKLMTTVTEFKWNAYARSRVIRRAMMYVFHFVLAATTLLLTTFLPLAGRALQVGSNATATASTNSTADPHQYNPYTGTIIAMLHAAMMITNTGALSHEVVQFRRQASSLQAHFCNIWNACDAAGIFALYLATIGYATQHATMLQQFGALAVLFNSFSFIQLLRPFALTGPLLGCTIEGGRWNKNRVKYTQIKQTRSRTGLNFCVCPT